MTESIPATSQSPLISPSGNGDASNKKQPLQSSSVQHPSSDDQTMSSSTANDPDGSSSSEPTLDPSQLTTSSTLPLQAPQQHSQQEQQKQQKQQLSDTPHLQASTETTAAATSTPAAPAPAPIAAPAGPATEEDEAQETARRTAEARAAFLASLASVGSHNDRILQARAQDIQTSSLAISKQEADVARETEKLAEWTDQYGKMVDESREKLKEIGDVQNWAEVLERDLLVLEETLRVVGEGGGGDGSGMEGLEGVEGLRLGEEEDGKSAGKGKGKEEEQHGVTRGGRKKWWWE